MTKFRFLLAAGAMAAGLAATANAAAYIKFDGVDGEAKSAEWGRGALWLTTDEDPVAIGLLLPAVQSAREAARRPRAGGGPRVRVFDGFEYSDTDSGMTYTLYDAKASPAGENRVRIDYRCRDWRNDRTGAEGSDCPGAQKGNVETTWKVEKGE